MEKKISFELFCTVVGRGLKQAVIWLGSLFGIKDGDSFLRFAIRVTIVSVSIISACMAIGLCIEAYDFIDCEVSRYLAKKNHSWNTENLSDDYCYYYDFANPGFIKNTVTGKKVVDDILWLYMPDDDDSLAVYKVNGNKRGYFNFNTGELQIKPTKEFEKAWVFSEGLASVMKDGEIMFINSKGEQAFENTFSYNKNPTGLFFHGGYCIAGNEEEYTGIIDKTGNWVLEPKYNYIENVQDRFWIVADFIGRQGIVNDSLNWILPIEYENINVSTIENAVYANRDGERKKYDLSGNVIEDFFISDARPMYYETENDGNSVSRQADCMKYSIDDFCEGLLSADGRPLTKAIYRNIYAISRNRFIAELTRGEYFILDEKGCKVN